MARLSKLCVEKAKLSLNHEVQTMMVNDRIARVLEAAVKEIKEPKSDKELYQALRLISAIAKHEAKKVLVELDETGILRL
jgi:flagellar biosynthesis regulator FlbT